jgi:hypothetical protein
MKICEYCGSTKDNADVTLSSGQEFSICDECINKLKIDLPDENFITFEVL